MLFYSLVFSLLVYLIICKALIVLKKMHLTPDEFEEFTYDDPFWSMLVRGKNDFFHQENQVMMISTLQITSLSVNIMTSHSVEQEANQQSSIWQFKDMANIFQFVVVPMSIIFIIVWITFIWQGTTLNVLFSKRKIITMTVIATIDLGCAIFSITMAIKDMQSLDKLHHKTYFIFIFIMNECCNFYSYITYFYYGMYKFMNRETEVKIGHETQKEIQFQEQVRKTEHILPQLKASVRESIKISMTHEMN